MNAKPRRPMKRAFSAAVILTGCVAVFAGYAALGASKRTGTNAVSRSATLLGPARTLPANEFEMLVALRMNDGLRKLIARRVAGLSSSPDGAVGRNTSTYISAAFQRDAIWTAMKAVVDGDSKALATTVLAMRYAFNHQLPAGDFSNTLGYNAVTAVGADAFFIQAFARIYTLLQDGKSQAVGDLKPLLPSLAPAVGFLVKNSDELYRQDRKATNRLLFDSIALTMGGRIVGDEAAIALGRKFLDFALANQRPDGTFDEHNGADTSYQAVSLLNLGGLLLKEPDAALKAKLAKAYCVGMQWEAAKVNPQGQVSIQGNSRTGSGQELFFGKAKDVNYFEVALAFYQASQICDPSYSKTGDKIVDYILSH